MGIWGAAIYSDDLAADIRNEYVTLLSFGMESAQSEQAILTYYDSVIGTEEEGVLWFSLALTEWNYGRLSEFVKKNALAYIESGKDQVRWENDITIGYAKQRRKNIEDLRNKLLSVQPAEKKIRRAVDHHSPWDVGDILAYHICTASSHLENPLYNKYALLLVLKKDTVPRSSIFPAKMKDENIWLGLYSWCGEMIPDPEIICDLQYISFTEPSQLIKKECLDLNLLRTLPENRRTTLSEGIMRLTEPTSTTAVLLPWQEICSKSTKKVITHIGHTSTLDEGIPSFFRIGIPYTITHYNALDLTLMKRLVSYYMR